MKYQNWVKKIEAPDELNFCVLPYDSKLKKLISIKNAFFSLILFSLQLCAGFINQTSSHYFWIFYPYILAFLPCVYFLTGAYSLFGLNEKISKKQWDKSLGRCRNSVLGLLIVSVLNCILEVIFIIINIKKHEILPKECIYLLLQISIVIICIFYSKFFNKCFSTYLTNREKSI